MSRSLKVWAWLVCSCLSYNSFAGAYDNSQIGFADQTAVKDWWLSQGGSIDSYFYSETHTTGSDGVLGNEYICLRDDVNKVYVGRSDVCANRAMDEAGYSYVWIDDMDWSSGSPSEILFQTGDLIGNTSQYWNGCFSINQGWGGYNGGSCPTINDFADGQINYGYIQKTLTNTAAINLALQEAGVEVTGYRYEWRVKNADANYESSNNPNSVDPFQVTVKIYDESGYSVYEKTYDYSYWINNWTTFSGTETFQDPFDADVLSEIQLSVTGKDIGYWAGYYGPEFAQPEINLNYRMAANPLAEDTTAADLLFTQMCDQDPLYDISCPNYQTAMLEQITASTTSLETVDDTIGVTSVVEDPIVEDVAQVAEVLAIEEETTSETITETIAEVVEEVGVSTDPVAAIEEASGNGGDTASESTTEQTASASGGSKPGLTSAQQFALSTAERTTAAAESTAQAAATQSAGVGLSESGGVSSELTADGIGGGVSDITDPTAIATTTDVGGFTLDATGSSQDSSMASTDSTGQTSSQSQQNSGSDSSGMGGFSTDPTGMGITGVDVTTSFDITGNDTQDQMDTNTTASVTQDQMESDVFVTPAINNQILDDIINKVTNDIIENVNTIAEQVAEKSAEESVEGQIAEEDRLVALANSGDTSEEAKSAALGFNAEFRAYQLAPQLPGVDFYAPKEIYSGQRNYDNPNARFFNGASDAKHKEMVRSQYK